MAQKAKWTVLTYIAAHNNLDALGERSLRELLAVGSSPDVALGALYDGKRGAGRYVMGEPGYVGKQDQLGAYDSADPESVVAAARWLFEQYPAERYGLVLWSHGTGWAPEELDQVTQEARPASGGAAGESKQRAAAPGAQSLFRTTVRAMLKPNDARERAILFDDGTGHSLDTLELARVVGAIAQAVGQPLELLGMDACLMANLEVACEVRDAVRYMVASSELVPGHSWPYGQIFGALRSRPECTGAEFAQLIVEQYVDYYRASPPPAGDVTKAALDLGRLQHLEDAIGALSSALLSDIPSSAERMWRAQAATMQKETSGGVRSVNKFQHHLWDVGALTGGLAADGDATPLRACAQAVHELLPPGAGAVLAEGHIGAWFDGVAGVSIYLPKAPSRVSPYYQDLAFPRRTRWGEFVEAYRAFFP